MLATYISANCKYVETLHLFRLIFQFYVVTMHNTQQRATGGNQNWAAAEDSASILGLHAQMSYQGALVLVFWCDLLTTRRKQNQNIPRHITSESSIYTHTTAQDTIPTQHHHHRHHRHRFLISLIIPAIGWMICGCNCSHMTWAVHLQRFCTTQGSIWGMQGRERRKRPLFHWSSCILKIHHSICEKNKMDDDTLWCFLVLINVNATELTCVRVTLVLDWHRVMAVRLELQKTVSHRIDSGAVSDLSGCYKLIVFDLFDACDCQQTYKCSSQLNALHLIHSGEKSYYVCLCCRAGQLNSNCAVYQLVRVVCLFSGFTACVVAGLYVGMSVCLCSLDSPLAQSVFIEQPPQIPTIAKLPAQTHRQYASQ